MYQSLKREMSWNLIWLSDNPRGYDLEYIAAVMSPLVGLTAEDLLMEWKNPNMPRTLIDEYWF